MKTTLGLAVLGLCVVGSSFAANQDNHPPISFVIPGNASSGEKAPPVTVVVESGFITHDNRPIPLTDVVNYINSTLKSQSAENVGVHIRQGIKFGEVVKALDELRKTNAKAIGVSMVELSAGKTL